MSDLFPTLFDGAALITGIALFVTGIKHTFNAMTLRTKGQKATATIERVDVRETMMHRDDQPVTVCYYTEVVKYTTWDGQVMVIKLPEKNESEHRGQIGETIEIRYNPDRPTLATPVVGSTMGVIGPILIVAGLALSSFAGWFILQNVTF